MKGFPNQVAKLWKLASGMQVILQLLEEQSDPKDDNVFGRALVRAGVAGTGRPPMPVDKYIRQQLTKPVDNQSFRTTARGLRELYRRLGFIDDSGSSVIVTPLGRQAASYAGSSMNPEQQSFWHSVLWNMPHDGGGEISHPYQVLLRLIEQKPGIALPKSALALEARNDSPEELARIVALADLAEEEIFSRIDEKKKSNWVNAKKVLPTFAIQIGDVIVNKQKRQKHLVLAEMQQSPETDKTEQPTRRTRVRPTQTSRKVTPATIGRAGTADRSDEVVIPPEIDLTAAVEAIKLRSDRLRRHNLIVQELAGRLPVTQLYEDPFDILALIAGNCILVEVKTLNGTKADERDRVRDALSQLLYYQAFAVPHVDREAAVYKIACFEHPISEAHREWLNQSGIAVIWKVNDSFAGDKLAANILGDYIEELR